jgi:hydrophobe/amphiphile efflux-1 (HAE1) family protein
MARFFIDRPVFSIVIAIVIVLLGIIAIPGLPVSAYPNIVPPVISVTATYLGGNAEDLERTIAEPIEEQLVGLDHLLYFSSTSGNDGSVTIQVTFALGTNPDIAAVQTQNRVNIALPRLPAEVQRAGVTVAKVSSQFLIAVCLISTDNRYDELFLTNYAQINFLNQIATLDGVGQARLGFNALYSMRVWVNPDRMSKLGISATNISDAIQAQNRQNPAGAFGQPPSAKGTDFQYPVAAPGRLTDPHEFENIVLRAQPDTSAVRLRDVARVEMGAQTYSGYNRMDGRDAANIIIYLAPGANAVDTADRVLAFMKQASRTLPPGIEYRIPYDSTMFVHAAIRDVLTTLFQAVALVTLVVFIFLQNWRATLIPLLTVPVALLGTFALFPLLGFSINITSMFGLVLAIGIVVDDAIVVVEAVQLNIDHGMSPREATIHAMREVSAPVVAIACILAAVFIPVAFLGGISGEIYRQFALTIATSVLLSAFNALSLSPALAAILLKPKSEKRNLLTAFFSLFERGFEWTRHRYVKAVAGLIRKPAFALLGLLACWLLGGTLFRILPGGFLPDEDQGAFFVALHLPDGASFERTNQVSRKFEGILMKTPGVERVLTLGGLDIATGTVGSNASTLFMRTRAWDERQSKELQMTGILDQVNKEVADIPEATTAVFGMPPIQGLSPAGGFQYVLEDRDGTTLAALSGAADSVVEAASKRPEVTDVQNTFHPSTPRYEVHMDLDKAQSMNVPVAEAYNTLQTFLGGLYVNDFNLYGHTWQVVVQADPEFRTGPGDIDRFYARAGDGSMVPLGTLARIGTGTGPDAIFRYNRYRAVQILGAPAKGYSTGQASDAMERISDAGLPPGFGYEWTGTTLQEKQARGHEGVTFGFAAVLVFLFLAALYESWSIPLAVILAVPLGLMGALVAVWLRSYPYDVYTQIGIVTLIGLSAKNAILIVEFARMRHADGMSLVDAAVDAARVRLRPILMTSLAFIFGVLPLMFAIGAGGASRRSLGTAVFGGMNAATLLAVFIVPVLYVVVERITSSRVGRRAQVVVLNEVPGD